jgi:hypothetical protein
MEWLWQSSSSTFSVAFSVSMQSLSLWGMKITFFIKTVNSRQCVSVGLLGSNALRVDTNALEKHIASAFRAVPLKCWYLPEALYYPEDQYHLHCHENIKSFTMCMLFFSISGEWIGPPLTFYNVVSSACFTTELTVFEMWKPSVGTFCDGSHVLLAIK